MPHLLVIVIQTFPMRTELFQAGLVDIVDPKPVSQVPYPRPLHPTILIRPSSPSPQLHYSQRHPPTPSPQIKRRQNSHTSRTPRGLPPLPHTLDLALALRLRLAHHVVIVERLAPVADEEGGAEQWGGGGADFFDGGDGFGEGGCVDEDLLVESGGVLAGDLGGPGGRVGIGGDERVELGDW